MMTSPPVSIAKLDMTSALVSPEIEDRSPGATIGCAPMKFCVRRSRPRPRASNVENRTLFRAASVTTSRRRSNCSPAKKPSENTSTFLLPGRRARPFASVCNIVSDNAESRCTAAAISRALASTCCRTGSSPPGPSHSCGCSLHPRNTARVVVSRSWRAMATASASSIRRGHVRMSLNRAVFGPFIDVMAFRSAALSVSILLFNITPPATTPTRSAEVAPSLRKLSTAARERLKPSADKCDRSKTKTNTLARSSRRTCSGAFD